MTENEVLEGDCIEVMATLDAESIDAIVTDPPYGLEFMGKEWDAPWQSGVGLGGNTAGLGEVRMADGASRLRRPNYHGSPNPTCRSCGGLKRGSDTKKSQPACRCDNPVFDNVVLPRQRAYQAWCEAWAREAFRVAKPGAYLIAAGGTRTYHRLACAIEDAGWEIRDCLVWGYASGFPKSLNVTKALRNLPACACDVPGEVRPVDASLPSRSVGAHIGAEPGAVPLDRRPADGAGSLWPDIPAVAHDAELQMDGRAIEVGGHPHPVVLGSSGVAGATEGDEIAGLVGEFEVEPEALRDAMVRDQGIRSSAVGANPVTSRDAVRDVGPTPALVSPPSATPSGIVGPGDAAPVVGGHTDSRAVDALRRSTGDEQATEAASEGLHDPHFTAEGSGLRCSRCGGIRQDRIPEGLGTALKPSWEPWVLARKPLRGTVAANVTAYGTGALNIAATRIPFASNEGPDDREGEPTAQTRYDDEPGDFAAKPGRRVRVGGGAKASGGFVNGYERGDGFVESRSDGRWPANLILTHPIFDGDTPGVVGGGEAKGWASQQRLTPADKFATSYHAGLPQQLGEAQGYDDSGTYSRFFLIPKADRADREPVLGGLPLGPRRTEREFGGADGTFAQGRNPQTGERTGNVIGRRANVHPTVKPTELMRHLVRLVTPPGGLVLDPFLGSGTTALAAEMEGFRWLGIEREPEYCQIARARLNGTQRGLGLVG